MHLRREYGMEMRADIDLGKDIKAANYSIRNKCKLHSPPLSSIQEKEDGANGGQRLWRGRRVLSKSSQTRKGWDLRHR